MPANNVSLSKAVRANLLSLQNTAAMMGKTQERLATGNKVNSALDNPTNFFTSASLNSRANDLNNLLDTMSNGIKTLEQADNAIKAITTQIESMQSTLRQARQDKSFKSVSFELGATTATAAGAVTIGGTAVGTAKTNYATTGAITFANGTLTIAGTGVAAQTINTTAASTVDSVVADINANTTLSGGGITATNDNGNLKISSGTTAGALTFGGAGSGITMGAATYSAKSVDEIVTSINSNATVSQFARASADNGKVRIENLRASADLTISSLTGGKIDFGALGGGTSSIGKNTTRADLITQFNEQRGKLDQLSDDASFNGVNLLRGDKLKITFNENGNSSSEIQSKNGKSVNAVNLGIANQENTVADTDAALDAVISKLSDALTSLRSQASSFGAHLSTVQNRQDFTKNVINTLQTGASNLTLADSNEEGANLLALQTRQQLSTTALSMASQSDQAVLRLF